MKKTLLIPGLLILSLIAMLLGGCSQNTTASTGTMQVYVTDAPPKDVTAIEIKASSVEAHKADADENTWVTLLNEPPIFDLVKAMGVNVLLGDTEVPVGKYTQIRLNIDEVTVTLNGQQVKAEVPSEKLKLVGQITVEEGKKTSISLDFDAEKSIIVSGADKVALKPVVKLIVAKPDEALPGQTADPAAAPTQTAAPGGTPAQTTTPSSTPTPAAINSGIAEVRATDAHRKISAK
jgi:hypothetical protein